MFNPDSRLVTESVQEVLETSLIQAFWNMIDHRLDLSWPPMDHIQLFELFIMKQNGKDVQIVVHSQQKPQWEKAYIFEGIQQPKHNECYWIVDVGSSSVLQPYNMSLHDYYREMKRDDVQEVL
jgi:hypothetical protein